MSTNYSQYLGAKRCCDLRVQGAQGPQGAQGAASVGGMGYQGATGAQGYQGATGRGCAGPTGPQGPAGTTGSLGPQGATGPSQWIPMNGLGTTGGGYTGIGVTGQDVLIYGNLLVTGGIDPIYLALTPQASGPTGFTNPLWVDSVNGNALRSQNIYMDNPSINNAYISLKPDNTNQIILNDGATPNALSNIINYSSMTLSDTLNTLTIDKSNITYSGATGPLAISSNNSITLSADTLTTGAVNVNSALGVIINRQGVTPPDTITTSIDGNTIEIFDDQSTTTGIVNQVLLDPNGGLYADNTDNTSATQSFFRGSPTYMEIYDHTNFGTNTSRIVVNSNTLDYFSSGTKPAFFQFATASASVFRYTTTGIQMGSGGTGVAINANNIKYPTSYNSAQATLTNTSNSVQTFNIGVAPFGAILPNATATNVGTQFTITNVNANNLGVTTTGGTQLIYSSTGAPSSVSRSLAQGHSQIFTAIQTTSASTFGWSMV